MYVKYNLFLSLNVRKLPNPDTSQRRELNIGTMSARLCEAQSNVCKNPEQ